MPKKVLIIILAACLAFPCPLAFSQGGYPETVSVLLELLAREELADALYTAYAKKALKEGYPHIAQLADALSASEGVHAGNLRQILGGLGVATDDRLPDVTVADTKTNLNRASKAELDEIDVRYPAFLGRVKPEGLQAAIDDLGHSWAAEKQHRELIQQLVQGSGLFFGMMAKQIESTPVDYYVCTSCGSTLLSLPSPACPICGGPVSRYMRVDAGR
ncbi:MAG: ferritin family protein [Spirochaetota bacterium]